VLVVVAVPVLVGVEAVTAAVVEVAVGAVLTVVEADAL
jgi:hypothetical protein